jgi:hypothetical protein
MDPRFRGDDSQARELLKHVIPAEAGIQCISHFHDASTGHEFMFM